jgi:hypothetical protein
MAAPMSTQGDRPFGHIKLSRKVFDAEHGDPWWNEKRERTKWEAWVDVIQLAAFQPRRYVTRFGPVDLERGEFVASLRWLADRWKWSIKRVRGWLAVGTKQARLRAQRETDAGTVYLIVKYDMYQSAGLGVGTPQGTPEGIDGAQQGHSEGTRDKQLKQVKQLKQEVLASSSQDGAASNAYDYGLACTITANQGLAEHPTAPQAIAPIIPTNASTTDAAQQLIDAGVPLDFAKADIYRQAKSHKTDKVSSLRYFTRGVIRAWQRRNATEAANGAARPQSQLTDPTIAAIEEWAREASPHTVLEKMLADARAEEAREVKERPPQQAPEQAPELPPAPELPSAETLATFGAAWREGVRGNALRRPESANGARQAEEQ